MTKYCKFMPPLSRSPTKTLSDQEGHNNEKVIASAQGALFGGHSILVFWNRFYHKGGFWFRSSGAEITMRITMLGTAHEAVEIFSKSS